ncbi:HS12A-like protein [Mya arenaria]|uniref:HS12A-like protein n=1 Tax=Mya arenaria TaxID=6604 RepID=A0ABY7FWZ4_MYAAR|nr:HS12A-like protein [Mya arenaria]
MQAKPKEEDIKRDMEIEDETGKKLKANFVFSAGISSDKLVIALEPEAAAVYCRFLPMENSDQEGSLSTLKTGSKVLVVDAGGGTVDIAVQELAENGSLKNIFKASGGDWGGTKVDEAYLRFLEDIIGKDSIDEFKRSYIEDYMFMSRHFEMKKREVDPLNSDKPVVFRISATLPQLVKQSKGKEIHDLINDSTFKNKVSIKADKLKVDMDVVKNFFKIQIDAIVDHVSNLLDQSTIAMKCLIVGEEHVEKSYYPQESSNTVLCFKFYYTLDPDPMYVTDEGKLEVPIEGSGFARSVKVRMIYGGTEIEVEATEAATRKVHRLKIDFLR